jgi:hypothetical protein
MYEPNWVIYKNNYQEIEDGTITSLIWTVVDLNTI